MDGSPPRSSKWSDDAFLNVLREASDPLADACARDLPRDDSLAFMFTKMRTDATMPAASELPAAFATFIREAKPSLDLGDLTGAEQAKLARGQQVFMRHALPCSLALLAKSLQEGYQAPRLGKVLMMSGELESSTYRRVLGVLQMLIQVASPGSFTAKLQSDVLPASDAGLTAIKVRLMHAGLRGIARRKFPDFTQRHGGSPISMEDMLATLIAFSHLVVEGLKILKIELSQEDAEAYHFVWRVFARTMGIHPPGQQKSWDWVPANLAEAAEFYASYSRRHYAPAEENEEGVFLAAANLRMLARKMRVPLAARIYMYRLLGPKASAALRIEPVPLFFLLKAFYFNFPRVWVALWRIIDRRADGVAKHDRVTQTILQRLVLIEYNAGVPSYRVPRDVAEIQEVVTGTQPGFNFGREQFAREVFPTELGDIAARRRAVGLDDAKLKGAPATDQGLVALSLSGGGIRSATFALGAVQALARQGCLKMMDYLSTVSGGGYTGSMLSSVLNDKESTLEGRTFPLDYETGQVEPPAVRHLRNGSNYLVGGGLLNQARLPTVLLRGILLNTLLVLPYIMLAALVTWWLFPWMHESRIVAAAVWMAFMFFSLLIWSYPAVSWLRGRSRTWDQRQRAEDILSISLITLIGTVLLAILSRWVVQSISTSWAELEYRFLVEISSPFELEDLWKWAILAIVAYAVVRISRRDKQGMGPAKQAALFLLGLTAPAVMLGLYLLMLAGWARSPFLPQDRGVERHFGIGVDTLRTTSDVLRETARRTPPVVDDSILLLDLENRGIGVGLPGEDNPSTISVIELPPTDEKQDWLDRIFDPGVVVAKWAVIDEEKFNPAGTADVGTRVAQVYVDTIVERSGSRFLTIHSVGFGEPGFRQDWWFAGIALLLFILNALWIDVNLTSPHGFWRDRLSRVFLFRSRWFGRPAPTDGLKLSELGTDNPAVPYHIINTSLNLTGSRVEDMPGRGSDFFMFSRRYCGSYSTGYAESRRMEAADPHLDLGTAMAISSAATAPNAGTVTIRPLVFMMTLLNVRLDYWAPNPWYVQAASLVRRLVARHGRPGPLYLLREALGQLHARGAFVNLSDGGHIENLAIYELLRRRCKVIVCADAEQDPTMSCASLAKLIRYARIDLGIEIDIDLNPLRLDDTTGLTHRHWTVGTIRYGHKETGYLLYVKSSVTGDEAPYVADYRARNPLFPQESTADQFFDEAQFESYRALGYHAMNGALKAMLSLDVGDGTHGSPEALAAIRSALTLDAERSSSQMEALAHA